MEEFIEGEQTVLASPGSCYRFGPFEANSSSGQLLKDGVPVRLQEQPFLLLIALLEKRGELVTRAELKSRIWPANIFVDFDSSLRVAVGKLRDALGDDANKPRYIETVPKRGYRFLGHPEILASEEISPPIEVGALGAIPPYPSAIQEPESARGNWRISIAILLVLTSTIAAFLYDARRPKTPILRNSVVMADFKNTAGDPIFDDTLRQGITVQLEQSPFLTIVSEDRIQKTLKLMELPPRTPLSSDMAREICERTMSGAVLDGSISGLGSQYVLGLRAVDCRTDQLLAQEQVQVARKEDVLNALSQMAANFRGHLGEASATLQKYDTPIVDATTGSIEALKFYTAGLTALASGGEAAALPLFDRGAENRRILSQHSCDTSHRELAGRGERRGSGGCGPPHGIIAAPLIGSAIGATR